MLPGKKYTPDEIGRILWRRRWLIVLPFAVGLAAALVIANRLPKLYRSETLIMVVPQRIPDSYVTPTVTASIEDRLPTISDQILSRSRLERIILEFDLYREARANGIMEDVVQRMRENDVKVSLAKNRSSFAVSYVSHDPKIAQKITERLASLYIEENLLDRANLADGTNQFLESQLEDAKRRLLEQEKKLEEYRRRFPGQLPSQLQANLQAIQNAHLQLQSVSESINRARERRLIAERELADARTLPVTPVQPTAPANGAEAPVPATAAQQLEAAQARLEAYRLRYTADHPDIRALERIIRDLQVKAAEEAKRPVDAAPPEKPLSAAEVARLKRIREIEADLVLIDGQIAAGAASEERLRKTIADYQAKVDAVPTRESELVELTRDYSTLQSTYTSLLAKHEEAKLAANLERRQIGEQFKILDPASLPQRPANQKLRLAVVAGGAGGGLLLGVLLVGLLEYRNSSFTREEEVLRVLTLPVLAVVPVMVTQGERRVQRRRRIIADVGGVAVLLVVAALVVLWRLQS